MKYEATLPPISFLHASSSSCFQICSSQTWHKSRISSLKVLRFFFRTCQLPPLQYPFQNPPLTMLSLRTSISHFALRGPHLSSECRVFRGPCSGIRCVDGTEDGGERQQSHMINPQIQALETSLWVQIWIYCQVHKPTYKVWANHKPLNPWPIVSHTLQWKPCLITLCRWGGGKIHRIQADMVLEKKLRVLQAVKEDCAILGVSWEYEISKPASIVTHLFQQGHIFSMGQSIKHRSIWVPFLFKREQTSKILLLGNVAWLRRWIYLNWSNQCVSQNSTVLLLNLCN